MNKQLITLLLISLGLSIVSNIILTIQILTKENNTIKEIPEVVYIDDQSYSNDFCTTAIEIFYEDNKYQYYFSCENSNNIKVIYSDGSIKTLNEVIGKDITIKDLDNYNITYQKREI